MKEEAPHGRSLIRAGSELGKGCSSAMGARIKVSTGLDFKSWK